MIYYNDILEIGDASEMTQGYTGNYHEKGWSPNAAFPPDYDS